MRSLATELELIEAMSMQLISSNQNTGEYDLGTLSVIQNEPIHHPSIDAVYQLNESGLILSAQHSGIADNNQMIPHVPN